LEAFREKESNENKCQKYQHEEVGEHDGWRRKAEFEGYQIDQTGHYDEQDHKDKYPHGSFQVMGPVLVRIGISRTHINNYDPNEYYDTNDPHIDRHRDILRSC